MIFSLQKRGVDVMWHTNEKQMSLRYNGIIHQFDFDQSNIVPNNFRIWKKMRQILVTKCLSGKISMLNLSRIKRSENIPVEIWRGLIHQPSDFKKWSPKTNL